MVIAEDDRRHVGLDLSEAQGASEELSQRHATMKKDRE